MRRGAAVVAGLVVVVALVLAFALRAGGDSGELAVLVLGDSYSAGNGAGDYSGPEECRQSRRNYGHELARLIEASSDQDVTVTTAACSGAITADLVSCQVEAP